jgi:hypothetical protein
MRRITPETLAKLATAALQAVTAFIQSLGS